MTTYIALLRGINVGGHKKVAMAELRKLLTKIGLSNVQTYIQSGNIIFHSSVKNKEELEQKIHHAIQDHFGFDVSVLVRTGLDLQRIFDDCPFNNEKKENSYFMLLHTNPNDGLIQIASEKMYEGEEYQIINDCLYLYCEKGYGKSKFNMNYFEKKLQTSATTRNYKTMLKLLSLLAD
ncbi:DUF1697 domain-containing protein [Flaviramulus sp. BrNp1-15]|uniref:DUF1697 domain-containing protein n=1 Tax=Flaviramulus sp. BrNp1-15 TaxID=2916754 RepID=UPI001EE9777D|nr:DUF1697 domain-containing protein [Flaviramulus sp. BrNp1-15]ULC60123.1 DUF1697 domain-containing protein [Flaviramulus sp. BrNp1-15]